MKSSHLKKKVALFGGSFNPPHEGHREILKRLARRKSIDEVWVLPVYKHAFHKEMAPFKLRKELCEFYLKPIHEKVKIKEEEKKLGGVSFTYRLVRHLQQKHPKIDFIWVVGEDAYEKRQLWRNSDKLEKCIKFLVFPRGKESPIPDVSSTELRKTLGKYSLVSMKKWYEKNTKG